MYLNINISSFCLRGLPFGGMMIFRVVALAKNGMWLNPGCRAANGGDKRRDPNWLGYWL